MFSFVIHTQWNYAIYNRDDPIVVVSPSLDWSWLTETECPPRLGAQCTMGSECPPRSIAHDWQTLGVLLARLHMIDRTCMSSAFGCTCIMESECLPRLSAHPIITKTLWKTPSIVTDITGTPTIVINVVETFYSAINTINDMLECINMWNIVQQSSACFQHFFRNSWLILH